MQNDILPGILRPVAEKLRPISNVGISNSSEKPQLQPNEWEMPELFSYNRLQPRAPLYIYDTLRHALSSERSNSPWFKLLNGQWKFSLFDTPTDVKHNHCSPQLDDSSWRDINVPANWTLEDTGDTPIYTNIRMPFSQAPPLVPQKNPSGLYRRSIFMCPSWLERRTVIHFAGVESMFYLYINGVRVGMSKDSRTPAEFDISQYLHEGENTLAVQVIRWSDGSFIEDQDHWWMAGIYLDVYLYSTDQVYIQDIFAQAVLDENLQSGHLKVLTTLACTDQRLDIYQLQLEVYDSNGVLVAALEEPELCNATAICKTSAEFRKSKLYNNIFDVSLSIPDVEHWNAESPTLYTVVASLRDQSAQLIEMTSTRVGFRRFEIKNKELLINGKAVLIKGVNRHEHDQHTGKTLTRELMIKDINLRNTIYA